MSINKNENNDNIKRTMNKTFDIINNIEYICEEKDDTYSEIYSNICYKINENECKVLRYYYDTNKKYLYSEKDVYNKNEIKECKNYNYDDCYYEDDE